MNEVEIEVATNAASKIINSLQSAIFSAMQAASENVESQVRMAASFQRLEARQSILDWLVARRISQEEKLEDTNLRPAQKALISHKIAQIDEELTALLRSSGIDDTVANKAVKAVVEQPRVPRGHPHGHGGRFLPKPSNGHQ